MVKNADKLGSEVTVKNDAIILKTGRFLRKYRIDEIPQLFNILLGDMSFVGTRPEVPKYVDAYTDEMLATLLLPAGVTSMTSVLFKNEANILDGAENPDEIYLNNILPIKMKHNLEYVKNFSFKQDIFIILYTIKKVFIDERTP